MEMKLSVIIANYNYRDYVGVAYFRPKSNQLGAHMFGFEQSCGDVIIFLDADDLPKTKVSDGNRWHLLFPVP